MGVNAEDLKHLDVKISWEELIGRNPNLIGISGNSFEDILQQITDFETRSSTSEEVETEPEQNMENEWVTNLKTNFTPELGLRYALLFVQALAAMLLILVFLGSFIWLFANLDFEEYREFIVTIMVILPFTGLSVMYLRAYGLSYNRQSDEQLELLSDILRPYEDEDQKLAYLDEILELDEKDNIPNWKIFDPDWKLSNFFPEFTLVDFLTILLVIISFFSAMILLFVPVMGGDLSDAQSFKNGALGLLIIIMTILGILVFIQNDSFEITFVKDLAYDKISYPVATYTAIPFLIVMVIGEILYDSVFFPFFFYFLLIGLYPLVIEITLLKISVIIHYMRARKKMPEILETHERYWDSKVRVSLQSDDQADLLRTLTAITLTRYSINNARNQPIVPNSNFGLILSIFTIIIATIGVIFWLLSNTDMVTDFIEL